MVDVKDRLKNASELVALPDRPFDRMVEKRDRRRRSQRLASAVVAFAIAAAAVGGGLFVLSRLGQDRVNSGGGWHSTKTLALRPGEYSYLKVTSSDLGDGHVRDEETWWARNGSGEVQKLAVQSGEVLAQLAPGIQQPLDNLGQVRQACNELANALLELDRSHHANLETKVQQQAADVVLDQVADLVEVAAGRVGLGAGWQPGAEFVAQCGQFRNAGVQGVDVGAVTL